jgi:hypothetical protein
MPKPEVVDVHYELKVPIWGQLVDGPRAPSSHDRRAWHQEKRSFFYVVQLKQRLAPTLEIDWGPDDDEDVDARPGFGRLSPGQLRQLEQHFTAVKAPTPEERATRLKKLAEDTAHFQPRRTAAVLKT